MFPWRDSVGHLPFDDRRMVFAFSGSGFASPHVLDFASADARAGQRADGAMRRGVGFRRRRWVVPGKVKALLGANDVHDILAGGLAASYKYAIRGRFRATPASVDALRIRIGFGSGRWSGFVDRTNASVFSGA